MKTAKKLLSLLLCMCMLMTCLSFGSAHAEGEHVHTYYNEPTWGVSYVDDAWVLTATFSCTTCEEGNRICAAEPYNQTVTVNREASCTQNEIATFSGTVYPNFAGEVSPGTSISSYPFIGTVENFELRNTATGHTYGEPSKWVWNDNHTEATASISCEKGDDDRDVTVSGEDIKTTLVSPLTCTTDWIVKYTATLEIGEVSYSDTTEEITIEKTTGHDYQPTIVAPTCTEQGYTEYKCTICNDFYRRDFTEATDHKWDDGVEKTPATCEQDGVKLFTCQNDPTHTYTEAIPAIGHDWNDGEILEGDEPTCTEAGVKTYTCKNDKNHTYTETIPALNHKYQAVTTLPTCTQRGYTTYTCENDPKHTYIDNYTDALGHSFDETAADKVVIQDPTCTTDGLKTVTCLRCSEKVETPIAMLGHSYDAVTTLPTCTQRGYTTYTCGKCGNFYVDDYVDALGHSFDEKAGDKVVIQDPTCTTDGLKTVTCLRCSEKVETTIAKLGHSYDAVTTLPTCTEQGYTTYTCSKCSDFYMDDYVAALGHQYDTDFSTDLINDTQGGDGWYVRAGSNGLHRYLPATAIRPETHRFTCQRCKQDVKEVKLESTQDVLGKHNFPDAERTNLGLFNRNTGAKIETDEDINAMLHSGGTIIPVGYDYVICQYEDCAVEFDTISEDADLSGSTPAMQEALEAEYKTLVRSNPTKYDDQGNVIDPANATTGRDVSIMTHHVTNWEYVEGTATCYFNGYSKGVCDYCRQVTYKVRTDKENEVENKRPGHHYDAWKCVDSTTHERFCTVCAGVNIVDRDTAEHNLSKWEYQEDHTLFKNGHEKRECMDGCGYSETREVAASSWFGRLFGWTFGASTFGAWVYTGIVFAIAKAFGVTLEIPTKLLEKFFK